MARFEFRVATGAEELRALRASWEGLLAATAWRSIFMTWDWQWAWWEARGGELFVVQVLEEGELVAILPFVRARVAGIGALRFLGNLDSDYLDLIVRAGREGEVVRAFVDDFLPAWPSVGIVELDGLNERSPNLPHLLAHAPAAHRLHVEEKPCTFIELPASWEDYLATLSPKSRAYVRRKERKLHADFAVRIGVVEDAAELGARLEQLFAQHQRRWRAVGRPGAFESESFRSFHRAIAPCLLEQGRLSLYFLELDGVPVGSYYMFTFDDALHFYASGFEPAYARYSPGVVLMAHVIRDALARGLREVDLMREAYDYKLKWAPRGRTNRTLTLVRRDGLAGPGFALHRAARGAAARVKTALPPALKLGVRRALPAPVVRRFDRLFRS